MRRKTNDRLCRCVINRAKQLFWKSSTHRIASDVYAEELEAFYLLHCGPVDVDGGVLSLLSPEVHDQLLRFVDVEGEVIFLAPLRQGPHLLPVGCLVIVGPAMLRCISYD
ncbi:hypothetical protein J4Q44_G00295790 [Coregonus suidteri]|uniref:Uncharacterized protein n=1 Tax=Coregonus suidteri TaxID=861788 RepID=A0AAN8L599_9TELE